LLIHLLKKRQEDKKEKELIAEIETLEKTNIITENLESRKRDLIELRRKKIEGSFVRSRIKWAFEGEKPTKYFCNLENRNFVSKYMANLYSKSGDLLTNQNDILIEASEHYKSLYAWRDVTDINLNT
jgi:hypothetical protein